MLGKLSAAFFAITIVTVGIGANASVNNVLSLKQVTELRIERQMARDQRSHDRQKLQFNSIQLQTLQDWLNGTRLGEIKEVIKNAKSPLTAIAAVNSVLGTPSNERLGLFKSLLAQRKLLINEIYKLDLAIANYDYQLRPYDAFNRADSTRY